MEILRVEDAVKKIQIYFGQNNFRPYFVIVDGAVECEKLKKFFKGFERIHMSDFCRGDTFPDTDKLIDTLKTVEKNAICFGLGEYIYFTTQENILRTLHKHKMNSAGKHAWRCCPINELDEKPACATEENGWWVLANYDRFAGGRLDSVELHGGATLEEILVPVIEFSLKGAKVEVKSSSEEQPSEPLKKSDDAFEFFE